MLMVRCHGLTTDPNVPTSNAIILWVDCQAVNAIAAQGHAQRDSESTLCSETPCNKRNFGTLGDRSDGESVAIFFPISGLEPLRDSQIPLLQGRVQLIVAKALSSVLQRLHHSFHEWNLVGTS